MRGREPRKLMPADFVKMNIPGEFVGSKLEEVPESVRASVQSYLSQIDEMQARGASLLLMGDQGVGKTALAVVIAKAFRENFFPVYFTTVSDLREAFRNRVEYGEGVSIFQHCKNVDVLVLDNLILLEDTDRLFNQYTLRDLLVHRGQHKKLTIMTVNPKTTDTKAMPALSAEVNRYLLDLKLEGPNRIKDHKDELKKLAFGKK